MQTQPTNTGLSLASIIGDAAASAISHAAEATQSVQAKRAKAAKRSADATTAKPRAPKPTANAKPGKPSTTDKQAVVVVAKPVKPDARQAANDQRAKLIAEARTTAARFYSQASLVAHKAKPAPRDVYIARALDPVQRCGGGVLSTRDESGLALALSVTKSGAFDPVACAFDAGVISRLASVNCVEYDATADAFRLTASGLSRARAITKRAAA